MPKTPAPQPPPERLWRGALTDAERQQWHAWLAAHPEARADWELEIALTDVLARLPDAPVPSNFTARVLQAVERDETSPLRPAAPAYWTLWLRRWLPRMAVAALLLAAGAFFHHRHTLRQQAEWRRSLALLASMPTPPSPQVLEDFEVIRQLGRNPPWDEELLALMQ